MPAQNCLVLAQNKTECEKTDSIREFQRQGRSLFFSKWVEGDIVSHLEYHLIVVFSNRSDNLSLHIAHFRIPPWRRGHKHTAAPTGNYVTIGANDKSKVFCLLFLSFLKQPCRKMVRKILFKTYSKSVQFQFIIVDTGLILNFIKKNTYLIRGKHRDL